MTEARPTTGPTTNSPTPGSTERPLPPIPDGSPLDGQDIRQVVARGYAEPLWWPPHDRRPRHMVVLKGTRVSIRSREAVARLVDEQIIMASEWHVPLYQLMTSAASHPLMGRVHNFECLDDYLYWLDTEVSKAIQPFYAFVNATPNGTRNLPPGPTLSHMQLLASLRWCNIPGHATDARALVPAGRMPQPDPFNDESETAFDMEVATLAAAANILGPPVMLANQRPTLLLDRDAETWAIAIATAIAYLARRQESHFQPLRPRRPGGLVPYVEALSARRASRAQSVRVSRQRLQSEPTCHNDGPGTYDPTDSEPSDSDASMWDPHEDDNAAI